ncbi:MAG: hypothetical protein HY062_05755 [Bacteroidetes bacterium]|nr:hypothetical protein [Bacteroidota bacterium]
MKTSFFKYLFFTGVIGVILFACVKKTTYPTTPEIEYQAFYPYVGDSADIQVKFKDGDGDIGVSDGDSTRTFWVTYYYKDTVTNKFIGYYRPLFNDTLRTGYIIKKPSDSYKGKPISGEVSVRLQQYRHSKKIKNIKYVIYLLDQAGNKSNVLTSPEITVQ